MKLVEQFTSINGEGRRAGQLAIFLRFAGCNLQCEYCDTRWANEETVAYQEVTPEELCRRVLDSHIRNVTLTGGEPLLQPKMQQLLCLLRQQPQLRVEIETNGSIDIRSFFPAKGEQTKGAALRNTDKDNVTFTLDYKLPISGMEQHMCMENYAHVRDCDTVKFVVGSKGDLVRSHQIIKQYHLVEKGVAVYLSPCYGVIDPKDMVAYMQEEKMNDVNLQLQLHKWIWDPSQRGV